MAVPSLSLRRDPKPNLTHERFRVLQNLFAKYPEKERGVGEPQLQPRRGVQACEQHGSQVGALEISGRAGGRAAAPVTPAARRGLRPALSRSLRGPLAPPAARPGPRLRPHSAASPQPRAAGLRGLTGPGRGAAALLSPPLPRSPGRWARGAGRPQ